MCPPFLEIEIQVFSSSLKNFITNSYDGISAFSKRPFPSIFSTVLSLKKALTFDLASSSDISSPVRPFFLLCLHDQNMHHHK